MPPSTIERPPSSTIHVLRDILPIFIIDVEQEIVCSFEGTGFLLSPHVLVTCWHCVGGALKPSERYAVVIQNEGVFYHLDKIERDPSGVDLATAWVQELEPTLGLTLASDGEAIQGQEAFAYGYPLTRTELQPDGSKKFGLQPRYLRGYITRTYTLRSSEYAATVSLELDMLAPAGMSGSPILIPGTRRLLGVVYGAVSVDQLEELAFADPETGERRPAVHRIVSFAAAHHIRSIRNLRGSATNGRSFGELLASA